MLKRILAGLILACGVSFGAQVSVTVLRTAEVAKPQGSLVTQIVDGPELKGQKVRKIVYPKYTKGANEWPAVIFPVAEELKSLKGYHSLVFSVFNPDDDVVDLAIALPGNVKYEKHFDLQPNSWNYLDIPVDELIEKRKSDKLEVIHYYMTRPTREYTLYANDVKLVKETLNGDLVIPREYPLVDFEKGLPGFAHLNAVKATLTNKWKKDGKQSALLTYTKYKNGDPQWPAVQIQANAEPGLGKDWSLFRAFQFQAYNPGGSVIPLRIMMADNAGVRHTQEFLINPGQDATFTIPFSSLALNVASMKQVDFFMTRPENTYEFYLDHVSLVAPDAQELVLWQQKLQDVEKTLAILPAVITQKLATELKEKETAIAKAIQTMNGKAITVSQLQSVATARQDAELWISKNSRVVSEARIQAYSQKNFPKAPFGIGVADSMTKVMIQDLSLDNVETLSKIDLELARNEYESFQMVVLGRDKAANASIEVTDIVNVADGSKLPADTATVSLVGHVLTKQPPYSVKYQGWWPDPLLDWQKTAPVKPGEAVSFWVRFKTPKDAKAGQYTAKVRVLSDKNIVAELPLNLRVFGFTLPDKSMLDTAIDFRDHIKQVWGAEGKRREEIIQQIADLLAEYKIDLDRIYRGAPAGHPEQLELYVEQLEKLRDRGQLRAFCIVYPHTERDITGPEDPKVQACIDRTLEVLDYWVPILKQKDLLKYAYIYCYDEIPASMFPAMAKICKAIKAKYPNIPIATTAYDHTFGTQTVLGDCVDIFTPLTPKFSPAMVDKARAQGRKVWWYICIGPHNPYANWFVEYAAIEARQLMGMQTAKYRPDGFLYYALSRWPENKGPIVDGPYTNWNPASFRTANGDGSLFCAGPKGMIGTIRAENFRDGLEDYAYFKLLEEAMAARKLSPALEAEAKEALIVPPEVVTDMTHFSHDPKVIRAKRRQLAETLEKVLK